MTESEACDIGHRAVALLTSREMSSLLLSTLGIVCSACDRLNPALSPKCARCGARLLQSSPAKAAENLPGSSGSHPASPSGKVSPLVDSVLAAQAHARPKPPVLAPRKEAPATEVPAAPRPPAKASAAAKASSPANAARRPAGPPIPAIELPKKRPPAAPAASGTALAPFVLAVVEGNGKGQRYRIPVVGCWVGRDRGNILFPEDSFVSSHHATLSVREGRLCIRDEGTPSGVFVAIAGQETIPHGTLFSIGRRLLRYLGQLQLAVAPAGQPRVYGAPLPPGRPPYAVEEVLVGGRSGRAVVSAGPMLTIGQTNCDFSFPNDSTLASRHCELAPVPQGAVLRDLSGIRGTFVRIAPGSDRPLNTGDRLRVGQQILQVETA
ncbi:MAG TPA: FHA domain-containing protein [Myxococcaceae bacterium]|nr:FHA domain-containing protein [Myxococcaceae bacterium]